MILAALLLAQTWTYWVQPCTSRLARVSGCASGDLELAHWALDAWQRASRGRLSFTPADREEQARIRIYWAHGRLGLYGETRAVEVEGAVGAEIYVRPDLSGLGPEIATAGRTDRLFRDTVVYLTCLHESGHALGLPHTAKFADIMYSFQYGGDILEYFSRYRRALRKREDIRGHAGMSTADEVQAQKALERNLSPTTPPR